jgi:hypothetical protein
MIEKPAAIQGLGIATAACASGSWALQPTEYAAVQQVCRFLSNAELLDYDSE